MYSVELSLDAHKFLENLDLQTKERIKERLKNLENNPYPSDSKFIGRHLGEKVFRYRLGKYRALYKVKDFEKTVIVTKIDKRDKVYQ